MTELRGKVLIIVENLPVPFDRRVWMEANTLRDAGYQVSIICPTDKNYNEKYECIDDIHIYRHDLPPEISSAFGYIREYSAALWLEWNLARRVKKERGFDVIHACNPPDLIFLVAVWFKLRYRTKFLFDHHDLNPELYESKFNRRDIFYYALRVSERLTFALADKVISTNKSYKNVALTRGHKQDEDVHIVRSGPNLDFFNPVEPNDEYRRGRKYLIGYLGVMGEFDGVDHLIRAADILINKRGRKDIQFCLIGGGPMLEELKRLTTEFGIDEYIEFTGRVSDEVLLARLSTCDIGVNPDPLNPLNDKSTMNKILEYMALELPIVQYNLVEGKESAASASLYANPNDIEDFATKIEELLSDEQTRGKMGKIGRQRMEGLLEWKHQIPRLLTVYEEIMA